MQNSDMKTELTRMQAELKEMSGYLLTQVSILDTMMTGPSVAGSEIGVARAKMTSTIHALQEAANLL